MIGLGRLLFARYHGEFYLETGIALLKGGNHPLQLSSKNISLPLLRAYSSFG